VRDVFRRAGKEITVLRALTGQFTFVVDGVYMTFFHFPYPITYSESFGKAARGTFNLEVHHSRLLKVSST